MKKEKKKTRIENVKKKKNRISLFLLAAFCFATVVERKTAQSCKSKQKTNSSLSQQKTVREPK